MTRVAAKVLIVGVLCARAVPGVAQDAPSTGLAYNFDNASKVLYLCTKTGEASISCEMRESYVRYQLDPSLVDISIARDMESLDNEEAIKEASEFFCREMILFSDGKDFDEAVSERAAYQTEMGKPRFLEFMSLMKGICDRKDRESLEQFYRHINMSNSKTCIVSIRSWFADYTKVANTEVWSADSVESFAGDQCRIVSLDRIERADAQSPWVYVKRTIAVNPDAKYSADQLCSERFDGADFRYNYREGAFHMDCQTIKFDLNY